MSTPTTRLRELVGGNRLWLALLSLYGLGGVISATIIGTLVVAGHTPTQQSNPTLRLLVLIFSSVTALAAVACGVRAGQTKNRLIWTATVVSFIYAAGGVWIIYKY